MDVTVDTTQFVQQQSYIILFKQPKLRNVYNVLFPPSSVFSAKSLFQGVSNAFFFYLLKMYKLQ